MIGYLEGEVLYRSENSVLLKASNGIGYEIYYTKTLGEKAQIFTAQIFKEKSVELYGFEVLGEKLFFQELLKVNGVGPKSAYSLVSTIGVDALKQAIAFDDIKTIKKAPGIGPKAAKQIVLDLKDKMNFDSAVMEQSTGSSESSFYIQAMSAFKELGFSDREISPIIKEKLKNNQFEQAEDLIKSVLIQINN